MHLKLVLKSGAATVDVDFEVAGAATVDVAVAFDLAGAATFDVAVAFEVAVEVAVDLPRHVTTPNFSAARRIRLMTCLSRRRV
ncbi:hypothetical protein ACVBEF_09505, partial [Glaciimonas sp. GG7]